MLRSLQRDAHEKRKRHVPQLCVQVLQWVEGNVVYVDSNVHGQFGPDEDIGCYCFNHGLTLGDAHPVATTIVIRRRNPNINVDRVTVSFHNNDCYAHTHHSDIDQYRATHHHYVSHCHTLSIRTVSNSIFNPDAASDNYTGQHTLAGNITNSARNIFTIRVRLAHGTTVHITHILSFVNNAINKLGVHLTAVDDGFSNKTARYHTICATYIHHIRCPY